MPFPRNLSLALPSDASLSRSSFLHQGFFFPPSHSRPSSPPISPPFLPACEKHTFKLNFFWLLRHLISSFVSQHGALRPQKGRSSHSTPSRMIAPFPLTPIFPAPCNYGTRTCHYTVNNLHVTSYPRLALVIASLRGLLVWPCGFSMHVQPPAFHLHPKLSPLGYSEYTRPAQIRPSCWENGRVYTDQSNHLSHDLVLQVHNPIHVSYIPRYWEPREFVTYVM